MKKIIYHLLLVAILFVPAACSEDDQPNPDVSVVSIEEGEMSEFDKYLEHIFVEPYNLRLVYKWVDIESDMGYQLVPASYKNSVKMANLIKYVCLDAYAEVSPDDFLKKYFPKMITLIGSGAYRNNGTMLLGTAESGLKIALYNVNDLNTANINALYAYYFRTIFHEFSHILHQTIDYTTDFDRISGTNYVGEGWMNAWGRNQCYQAGFISNYSSKEPNEDFVELIAHYITNTPASWEAKLVLAEADGAEGRQKLNQKMEIIRTYMKEFWDIDIDALRDAIQSRVNNLQQVDLDNITIE
jgi:substrate import-associated zinc metallohydrolase lipoprotein